MRHAASDSASGSVSDSARRQCTAFRRRVGSSIASISHGRPAWSPSVRSRARSSAGAHASTSDRRPTRSAFPSTPEAGASGPSASTYPCSGCSIATSRDSSSKASSTARRPDAMRRPAMRDAPPAIEDLAGEGPGEEGVVSDAH